MFKKNLKLILIFVLLALLTVYFVSKQSYTTLKKELTDFAVKDTSSIDKIFLADKSGNHVLLVKKDAENWTLNNSQKARMDMVHQLFKVVNALQVSSPVGKSMFNNLIKQLATTGIKAEFYSKGEKIKTIYVGGSNQLSTGTYMMLENSSTPYAVTVPGFEGYLTPNFNCHEMVWRSSALFNYSYHEISNVEVTNYEMPKSSFSIQRTNEHEYSKTILKVNNYEVSNFDTAKVNLYLLQFKNLNYEIISELVRPSRKDSAMHMPLFKVVVTPVSGQKQTVQFYKKPVDLGTALDDNGKPSNYDTERMFTILNGNEKDLLVTQYFVFNKILVHGQSFLK